MNLDISDDQFKAMVQKAIFEALTPEKRDELVQAGIRKVFEVESGSWDKKSELQRQFANAVSDVTRKLVASELEQNANFMIQMRRTVQDAMMKVFDEQTKEKLTEKIADTIINSIWRDR